MPAASSPSAAVPRRTVVLGHSVDGRRLVAQVIGPDSARRKVLLLGCIHGNECAGLRILSAAAARRPPAGVQLWLVGELNPDGTAAGTRQNAHGVDLKPHLPLPWEPNPHPNFRSGPPAPSQPETR